jgi:hypothetical protein
LFALLAPFAIGCGGDDDTGGDTDAGPVGDGGPPRVELGTGQANFMEIGDTMEVVLGPQGGWHFFVSCRLYNMTVEGMRLEYKTERDGAIISMPGAFILQERRLIREGDHYLRVGDLAIFDIAMPSDVTGDTVTVTVTADPPDGEPISDSHTVVAVDEIP